ncbi:5-methyltetrahydropteroyltriglutamate--homocysteine S-methyltransferase [Aeromonas simiae]|uniref:5-methyltetrahydropteroyltriglutamate--homocysteine methyltransferase n=1 Tax=Aeromonas simiae TaxID=218936 RepID=A0A5J6WX99_9GAMM|nr:5-methyltetrahydropteroyltriglutamate--homocysteine S-methyltransferase [Aeromonas simiae]QFI54518.1 5-methyltetrahydropteroyltriglutamate--homocysteine S-methyltransferase [Aeromonas simiae]
MTQAHTLGFPRIGAKRELKFALEAYWRGEIPQAELLAVGKNLRQRHWQAQREAGVTLLPVGDFAWYDQVLGTSLLVDAIPERHRDGDTTLDTLFRVARGRAPTGQPAAAAEMTKWFNTNYHYLVPEFHREQRFRLGWSQLFDEVEEAKALGLPIKAVLLGPVTYLWLGKEKESGFSRLELLDRLLIVYQEILAKLAAQGVEWVQIDEPALTLDLPDEWRLAYLRAYERLAGPCKLLLTPYFGSVAHQRELITSLKVDGLHLDLVAAPEQLDSLLPKLPAHWVVSAGVINGRNVWRANLLAQAERLAPLKARLGERLWIATSCSLLHSPVDLSLEQELPPRVKSWFAFALQKCYELGLLAEHLNGGAVDRVAAYSQPIIERASDGQVHKPAVQARLAALSEPDFHRLSAYPQRAQQQRQSLRLPLLPTTTIGSFPQTREIRALRQDWRAGRVDEATYEAGIRAQIEEAIARQEAIGLDVLVHGEAERNDMVEYFGEQLGGFAITRFGWVQSYGSRCVKPPVITGDIDRPAPMTLAWINYAQSLTDKPVKGMLTGPVTILCWSFPREDVSREQSALQIALAIRDEVADLEAAGVKIIQIDEPAIREGLPLRAGDHQAYLDWAVRAFRLSASPVADRTQIHTHMCYSDFNLIIEAVAALDADVITIETSRSQMQLLGAFERFNYPNEIGPGVYDIHSPNVPSQRWIEGLLRRAAEQIPVERLWVNPDCGLKTRGWEETEAALHVMVAATKALRQELAVVAEQV